MSPTSIRARIKLNSHVQVLQINHILLFYIKSEFLKHFKNEQEEKNLIYMTITSKRSQNSWCQVPLEKEGQGGRKEEDGLKLLAAVLLPQERTEGFLFCKG
jgi:hypothetical protein